MDLNKPIKIDFKKFKPKKIDLGLGLGNKIKIGEKDKNVLAVLGTVLILLCGWQFMLAPQYNNIKIIQTQITQNQAKADLLLNEYNHLPGIRAQIDKNTKTLNSLDKVFPKNLYTEQVLNYVDGIARHSGVRMASGISISEPAAYTPGPGKSAAPNFYKRDISASFTGSYYKIINLMTKLQNAKTKIILNSVSLSPGDKSSATVNLTMSIFTYSKQSPLIPGTVASQNVNINSMPKGDFNLSSALSAPTSSTGSGNGNGTAEDEKKKSAVINNAASSSPDNTAIVNTRAGNGNITDNASDNKNTSSFIEAQSNKLTESVAAKKQPVNITAINGNNLIGQNTKAYTSEGTVINGYVPPVIKTKPANTKVDGMDILKMTFDFNVILRSSYSDQPSVIIDKYPLAYTQIAWKDNKIQDIYFDIKKENGAYYYRYSVGDSKYPGYGQFSKLKLTSSKYIGINVISQGRVTVTDLSAARFNISNNTGLPIYLLVSNEDKKNPRASLGKFNGKVKIVNR